MEQRLLQDFQKMQEDYGNGEISLDGLEDLQNDPLLAPDFNIIDYFNDHYKDEKALDNIQEEIQKHDQELIELDQDMKKCIRQQAYA